MAMNFPGQDPQSTNKSHSLACHRMTAAAYITVIRIGEAMASIRPNADTGKSEDRTVVSKVQKSKGDVGNGAFISSPGRLVLSDTH
jgi:hypothetical protein